MKRKILIAAAALVVLLVGALALGQDRLVDHVIRQRLQQKPDQTYLARDGHIRVLLCGTGSPEVSAAKAQACTLVAAGGKLFLFDVGDGAVHALAQDKVPVNQLTRAFITHYHSDHFGDLGPLINSSWIWGRKTPLEIQGPVGMNQVLAGITQAHALDEGYRAANMPHLNAARAVARGVPMEIQFPAGQNTVRVYDQDGVTVDANVVVHDPVKPALGYTISYAGKKVFVSGDTEISPVYLDAMKGADLVVHEAYATHMVRRAIPQLRALGRNFEAEVTERTIAYHADTVALAKQAEQAGVKHLVLTHLIPYPDGFLARHLFVEGISDHYRGQLTVGADGMLIIL